MKDQEVVYRRGILFLPGIELKTPRDTLVYSWEIIGTTFGPYFRSRPECRSTSGLWSNVLLPSLQGAHSFFQGLRNHAPATTLVRRLFECLRFTDLDFYIRTPRPFGIRRQRFEGSTDMAGDDRDIRAGHQHADAVTERRHLSSATASSFGKQNVAARLIDQPIAQCVQRMSSTVFPPHRQGVNHAGGEYRNRRGFEERIAGGEWKDAISKPGRQSCRKKHHIEVARMIGDHHERRSGRQIFAAEHLDMLRYPQDTTDPPPPKIAPNNADQAALTLDRTQSLSL